ncbi:RagB/SusD family nutrient uptake outer membrane protein [Pedobacter cryophilus]|uniref:RagB/SusD family nutrient uptake outer membrane protein n=1 Tax=Pedobacter cryophilus TaxID=2571271 RepID=A0A4U1BX18_9SPHI|nr:RagB/SusD family nutrient uptake outer membrane protein [Pedobacter cryophilus]TKB96894.1 RagB/SusD family nutrient uptake outer membrane protein [Pedobacter cryophilus]
MMKKIKIFIFTTLAFITLSCNKSLELNPTDFSSPENYYNTEQQLNFALNGIYGVLRGSSMYGGNLNSSLAHPSDEALWRYNTASSTGFEFLTYNSSAPLISSLWGNLYNGINLSNLLLENMDKATASDEGKKVIRGEALFLRAYYYFLLVDHFGGVPLKLKPSQSPDRAEDVSLPRSSIAEVYAQITKDMLEAETLVKPISAFTHSGRVTQTVVQGMLARVYLTMAGAPLRDVSKYVDAKLWAGKVIESGLHSLNPNYKQIFVNHNQDLYDNRESMWEVEFFGNTNTTNLSLGGRLGILTGIFSTNEAYPGFCTDNYHTTAKLYNLYQQNPNDLRRDVSIAAYRYVGTSSLPVLHTATQIYERATAKWRREYETLLPRSRANTSTNFPLLRYADVLLMYAEAENELNGPTQDALDKINMVRRRAMGTGSRISAINIVTQGTGYNANHTISFSGGGGDMAYADAILTSGRITGIRLVSGGAFYTSAPTVTITGVTAGTGATATAVLTPINPAAADLAMPTTNPKITFFKAIQDERARELAFETIRLHDLKRWGIYIESLREVSDDITNNAPATWKFLAQSGLNATPRNVLFPIPLVELTSNPNLVQNLGY